MLFLKAVGEKLVEGAQNRLKAYHGSPHDFDRFSTENIGTGEGAQAYGHGLYFAEREGTAMSYRDALTPRDFDYEEHLMEQYKVAESMEDYNRMDMLERAMQHDTPADFRDIASDADYDDDYRQLANDMADEMEGFVNPKGNPVNFGRMYEVDINASPDELLDYDVDLIDQSQKVKDGILKLGLKDLNGKKYSIQKLDDLGYRGQTLYEKISVNAGADVASMRLKDVGIKGIKYADAQTRFSPKGRTNNYVMFDDKTIEIARKYGVSMPVAGAILAGTMTPEQAQAGPIANAIHIGQRIIDLGMLKADSINNPRAINLATNKYNKLMKENEAFADRERKAYANGFETIFNPTELPPRKIITPEDLQGKTIGPVRGDRSDLGHLTQVGGQKVDVDVQAGKKFSRQNGGWASAEGIAQGQHAKLVAAAEDTQNDVVGVYNAMGEDSVNFSTPIAQGMFQQIPALQKLDLADVKKFDEEVRGFKKTTKKKDGTTVVSYPMKDWVGLDHPEAMSQIMGKDGYPKFGALRTVLTTTMSKAHYRDRGFPSYKEMVKAVEDPELAGANIGDAGISTYNVDAAKGIEPIDYHDSYSHRMPGDDNGGLEQSLPFEVFFPESYKRYRNTKTKSGKLMTHDQAIVAMNIRKDGYEVADQKWLDGVEKYKAKIAAGTITAGFAGSASAAETDTGEKNYDAIYAERDARKTMSPRERKHAPRASEALRDHTLSTMLPSLGNAVQGWVRGGAETLDYLHPANLTRLAYDPANEGLSRFTAPSIVNPVSNLVAPVVNPVLYDEDDPEAVERAKQAKGFGALFSF